MQRGQAIAWSALGWILPLYLGRLLTACGSSDQNEEHLPSFAGESLTVGALVCLTGAASSGSPDLDRIATLTEEFVNGSTRAYEETADEIPCRLNGTCGALRGRDDAGNDIRGPLRLVLADSEERPESAVASARRMREEHGVPAIIIGCSNPVVERVFAEVTTTEVLLVSPNVSADNISLLPDRTPEEISASAPGWVYRTVTPDYVIARFLAQVGQNTIASRPLVRFEDQTDLECSTDDECSDFGDEFRCRPSIRSSTREREFINITSTACAEEPATFCDRFGLNYECQPFGQDGEPVCAQFRSVRFCTREVNPRTAMVLYEDSEFGRSLRDEVRTFWQAESASEVLSEVSFDPTQPQAFGNRVTALFLQGVDEFRDLQASGDLDEDLRFDDSVVFLFSNAVDGSLLLQEWSAQLSALEVAGADSVFWLSTDRLRNRVLTNTLNFDTIRNLHVVSSSVLDLNNGPAFEAMYRRRWGSNPPNFAAHLFDAVLLLALANERAGALAALATSSGSLPAPTGEALKNAFPEVAGGCHRPQITDRCRDLLGRLPTTFRSVDFTSAVRAARTGDPLLLVGTTGDLSMSPAGDRISELALLKVEAASGGKGRFFELERFTPQFFGVSLVR